MIQESTDSGLVVEIPTKLGHYAYLETIGTGGTCVVVLVENSATHQKFAAKFVPRDALTDPIILRLFERELRIFQRLRHPNVCRIEEVIYLRKSICVVMEHCPGGDLLTYLGQNKYVMPFIKRRMFYELCLAVEYLHSRGVVHRDLKPENIFLDADLHVKLGDFGLAHETKSGQLLGTLCGTLYYSAPELLKQNQYDGKKVDIWALGLILFCMQVMSLPWRMDGAEGVKEQIMKAKIDIPESVAKPIAQVIRSCCVLEPKARLDVAEILKLPWMREEEYVRNRSLVGRSFVKAGNVWQSQTEKIVVRRVWNLRGKKSALELLTEKAKKQWATESGALVPV